jgi:O-antigen/teichoic acid export membrane protein
VASNATWLTVALVAARACTFALAIVLARKLGVSAYGRYGIAVAIGSMIVPLFDIGITPYMTREVARNRASGDLQAVGLARQKALLAIAALSLTALITAIVAPGWDSFGVLVVMVASMLADGFSGFVYSYFQGLERMAFQARQTTLAAMARGLGGIACVFIFGSLLSVIAWMLVVSAVQVGVAARRFTGALGERAPEAVADRRTSIDWRSVITMGLITLFALIYLQVDAVIIGIFENNHAVGLYVAAYAIVGGLQIIPWQIAVALTPVFARSYSSDPARFQKVWQDGLRAVLLISVPLALVATLLAGPLLTFAFGAKFHAAATALAILAWSSPIWSLNMTCGAALRAAGRERWLAWATGVGLALNIGLNLWAVPEFGIAGASAVTVATELGVLVIIQASLMLGSGVVGLPRLPLVRMVVALAGLSAVTLAASGLPVVLAAALGLAAYAVIVIATRTLERSELRALFAMAARGR